MQTVSSALSYYLIWGVLIGCGVSLSSSLAVDTVVTNWFIRKRGPAFSIRWGIISIIAVACLPRLSWMVHSLSWKTTCTIWGIFTLASSVVLLFFIKQQRPEFYKLLPDGTKPQNGEDTGREAMVARGKKYAEGAQEIEYTLSLPTALKKPFLNL